MNHRIRWHLFVSLSLLFAPLLLFAQTPQLIGVGQNSNVTVTTSNTQPGTDGTNTLANEGFLPNHNAASRFLQQATFGPTYEDIVGLSTSGMEDWIDQQFTLNPSFSMVTKVAEITDIKNAGLNDPMNTGPFLHFWNYAYWEHTMTSPDVLRQRIALALSEILVISENSGFGENAYAFADYYDMLLQHAFGNYRDLLEAVTFTPAMAMYLTYMNNPKQDTIYEIDEVWPYDTLSRQVVFPDENYAREIMQLFSIGLCELNIDGTCQTDENGVPVPTYNNVDIAEMSKIFTGLTWQNPWCTFGCGSLDYFGDIRESLVMVNDYHDPGEKRLLNGHVVQPRNPVDGVADIREALDNIFNHPNVGPFIGKLLIQRLVTSNPSPEYVARVARAFNGDTHYSDQRGDMRAVIKAILLDDEARNCASQSDNTFGMLREPFVRYLQLGRSFNLYSPNAVYRNAMQTISEQFGQKIFASPSVFNFFQQDYQPIGPIEAADKVAPEFQITNSQTITGYLNSLQRWAVRDGMADDWGYGFEQPYNEDDQQRLDLTDEILLATDDQLPELIDRLDLILAHGQLSQRTKDIIRAALLEISIESNDEDHVEFLKSLRVRMALFYIMVSPEYLVNR
ncbi:MAG: DUF1800 family protein [Bacteroidota bacterium]